MKAKPTQDDCLWAQDAMLDRRVGALVEADAQRWRAHLAGCPACAELAAADHWLTALFQDTLSAPPSALPGDSAAMVRERVRQSRRRSRSALAAVAVLVAMAMFGGWLWMRAGGNENENGDGEGIAGRAKPASLAAQLNELSDVAGADILTSSPPVARLDVLANQQQALLAELKRWPIAD